MSIGPEEMEALKGRGNRLAIIVVVVLVLLGGGLVFGLWSKSTSDDRVAQAEKTLRPKYENLDLAQFAADYDRLVVADRLAAVKFPTAPHAQWVTSDTIGSNGFHVLYEIDTAGRTACLTVATEAVPGRKNTVAFSTEGHTSNNGMGCH